MLIELPATVAQVMTRQLTTLREDDDVAALRVGIKTSHGDEWPVTDGLYLLGLVTARDLASTVWGSHQGKSPDRLAVRCRVADIMQRDVMTITPEARLEQAGALLLDHDLGCLPVLDRDNVLVGMLTRGDYVRLVVRAARIAS
jgi:acetoin utilization protein AcuB